MANRVGTCQGRALADPDWTALLECFWYLLHSPPSQLQHPVMEATCLCFVAMLASYNRMHLVALLCCAVQQCGLNCGVH